MSGLVKIVCVLLFVVCSVKSQSCDPSEVESCAAELKSIYSNKEGPVIVKNEAELITLCGHQQRALKCINNFVDRCLKDDYRNVFVNLTSGVQDFVDEFCHPQSESRKIYVKHLDCFNGVSDQVNHCVQGLNDWQQRLQMPGAKKVDKTDTMKEACCHYDSAMTCVKTVVRSGCPGEAADLFDDMIAKVTKQFLHVADCKSHNYDIGDCNGASSLVSPPSSFLLTLTSLLAVLISMFRKCC